MKTIKQNITKIASALFLTLLILGMTSTGYAHCDRVNGPVATDAREALKTGDVTKVLIWVGEEQAEELKSKFRQSLEVYRKGDDSKDLAERYFMETTVRLHREAEGMPYTGLKPAQPSSGDIQAAEKALDTGNLTPVNNMLASEIQKQATELFREALEARKHKDESVAAGREWADAYVRYIIYIHNLYQTIQAGPPHGVGE